ncbi:MAG: beta-lactamase family protein [Planctomycetia bacterium]|nr:beta-lactamase family protein [Planctomycetia bacterium]
MARSQLLVAALVPALFLGAAGSAAAQAPLDDVLTPYLTKHDLPALAAAVVRDGKVIAAGAVGTRKAGEKIPVTLDDRFHLGSDTKAMTALLAAMFVDEGKLKWTSTLPDVFPKLAEKMDADLKTVTLEQFLSHTSGVPSDSEPLVKLIEKTMSAEGNLDELRYLVVEEWSKQPLASKPGAKFAYANMNFIFAGAMIERLAGKTWEELITERVFAPLELKTAGLGCQASLGKVDAPLGHEFKDGKFKAFLAGPNGDNPAIIGPAGNAHMSVLDFARWAGWNAGLGKRGPNLVKPETLKKLQAKVISMPARKDAPPGTPPSGGYALGWGQLDVQWAPAPLIYHGGSNGKNLAHIWVDPQRDFAMVFMTNVSNLKTEPVLFKLAEELFKQYSVAKP